MPQFCNQCGATLRPGAKFCAGCGAAVADSVSTASRSDNRVSKDVSTLFFKRHTPHIIAGVAALALFLVGGTYFFGKPKFEHPDCLSANDIAAGMRTCAEKESIMTAPVPAAALANASPPHLSPCEIATGAGRYDATVGDQDIVMEASPDGKTFDRIWYKNRASGNRCSAHLVIDREDYLPEPENRYDIVEAFYYKQIVMQDDKPCAKQLMIYFTNAMQAWSGSWIENGQTVMEANFTQ